MKRNKMRVLGREPNRLGRERRRLSLVSAQLSRAGSPSNQPWIHDAHALVFQRVGLEPVRVEREGAINGDGHVITPGGTPQRLNFQLCTCAGCSRRRVHARWGHKYIGCLNKKTLSKLAISKVFWLICALEVPSNLTTIRFGSSQDRHAMGLREHAPVWKTSWEMLYHCIFSFSSWHIYQDLSFYTSLWAAL